MKNLRNFRLNKIKKTIIKMSGPKIDPKELHPKILTFTDPDPDSIIHQFHPNLTPRQIFALGSFGGTYWRPIKSAVTNTTHKNHHIKFTKILQNPTKTKIEKKSSKVPKNKKISKKLKKRIQPNSEKEKYENWFSAIPDNYLIQKFENYDKKVNNYKVKCGSTLEQWEEKNWIKEQDPYGWVEWYCNFSLGRRSEDDERQIKRWLAFCGPKGRFRRQLINRIYRKKGDFDDFGISPVVRQSLQHWGFMLTKEDFESYDFKG